MDLLKIPAYLPELLLVFFIPYLTKKYKAFLSSVLKRNSRTLIFGVLLFMFLIVWSTIFNSFGLIQILSTARSYFYIFLFYLIGKNISTLKLQLIYYLALGSVISSFFEIIFILGIGNLEKVYYLNLTAIFLVILIPILHSNYWRIVGLFPFLVTIAVFSGLRRAFIVIFLAFLFGGLIKMYVSKGKQRFFVPLLILLLGSQADRILVLIIRATSNNIFIFKRIIGKSFDVFESGGSVGDFGRIRQIQYLPQYFLDYLIFPHGFITKNPQVTNQGGLFMDLPLFELFYSFSSIVVTILLIRILFRVKNRIIKIIKYSLSPLYFIIPCAICLFISFLFFDGSFLKWPYATFYTGLFLGLLFNKKVQISPLQ